MTLSARTQSRLRLTARQEICPPAPFSLNVKKTHDAELRARRPRLLGRHVSGGGRTPGPRVGDSPQVRESGPVHSGPAPCPLPDGPSWPCPVSCPCGPRCSPRMELHTCSGGGLRAARGDTGRLGLRAGQPPPQFSCSPWTRTNGSPAYELHGMWYRCLTAEGNNDALWKG